MLYTVSSRDTQEEEVDESTKSDEKQALVCYAEWIKPTAMLVLIGDNIYAPTILFAINNSEACKEIQAYHSTICNPASIPTSPGIFKSAKNDIPTQPNLPSSSLNNEIESITDHFIDLTKKHDKLSDISEDDETTPLITLFGTIIECERFLASVKQNAVAYRDSTAELRAKLRVAETESKELAAAFTGKQCISKKISEYVMMRLRD
ncbi:uncharacterized protein Bfra_000212 [Botrytis fragariae]|uniref:Uncharacterized protein n=1 Tax=Botrytis fragariae TaxID=1964551 RepID=A0A8H6B2Q4_9HELO|nr:uncharacterized protein Bfra_000212 [Botrytis fragariae]KAF5878045.1 hypothetical protein Bfra_000212 [Botrytis fragariae]